MLIKVYKNMDLLPTLLVRWSPHKPFLFRRPWLLRVRISKAKLILKISERSDEKDPQAKNVLDLPIIL